MSRRTAVEATIATVGFAPLLATGAFYFVLYSWCKKNLDRHTANWEQERAVILDLIEGLIP